MAIDPTKPLPISSHLTEGIRPAFGTPLTSVENKEEDPKKFSTFFLDGALADLSRSGRSPSDNLLNTTKNTLASLSTNTDIPLGTGLTRPPVVDTIKEKNIELATDAFKQQVNAVMGNPDLDDVGRASLVQSLFNEHASQKDPDTFRAFVNVLNDTSMNNATAENKSLRSFVNDTLEQYQDYVSRIGLISEGGSQESFADKDSAEARAGFLGSATLPLTFSYQIQNLMGEVLPDQDITIDELMNSGEAQEEFKAALRSMPLEQQLHYAKRINNLINDSSYFGVENDFLRADLAQALLKWDDTGDIGVATNNLFGTMEMAAVIPVIGTAIKTGTSAGRALVKRIASRIMADGRTFGSKLDEFIRLRPKENSAWAIANSIDPQGARLSAQQILTDPTGKAASATGVTKEALVVETMFPKLQGSKPTPGISINTNDGFFAAQFSPEEIRNAQVTLAERAKEKLEGVRRGLSPSIISPNNVFYKLNVDDIEVEHHVTLNDTSGFSTLEHARSVGASYENQLRLSDNLDGEVEVVVRTPGLNEYLPISRDMPEDLIEGSDFRVVVRVKEPLRTDAHALTETTMRPDKISGTWSRFFDKSIWGKDWFNIATNISYERNSKLNKALTETIQPLTNLRSAWQREVAKALDDGEAAKRWYTLDDLKDRWGHQPNFEALTKGYLAAVDHQKKLWSLQNYGYRKLLESGGYKELFFKSTKFFDENVWVSDTERGSNIIAKQVDFVPSEVTRIYDPAIDDVRDLTDVDRVGIKEGTLLVHELHTPSKKGINEVQHIVYTAEPHDKFIKNELPVAVLNNEPGYISRNYEAGYLVRKLIKVRDNTGAVVDKPVTIGIERNIRDADIMLDELRAEWKAKELAERATKYRNVKAKKLEKFTKNIQELSSDRIQVDLNKKIVALRKAKETLLKNMELLSPRALATKVGLTHIDADKMVVKLRNLKVEERLIPSAVKRQMIEDFYKKSLSDLTDGSLKATKDRIDKMVAARDAKISKSQATRMQKFSQILDRRALTEIERVNAKEVPTSFTAPTYFDPLNTDWLKDSGQLYTSSRRLEEIRGKYEKAPDPVTGHETRRRRRVVAPISEAFEAGRMAASRAASLDLTVDKLVSNWKLRYGEMHKESTGGTFPWVGRLKAPEHMTDEMQKEYQDALAMSDYIKRFAGVEDDIVQRVTRRTMVWMSEKLLTSFDTNWQVRFAEGLLKHRDLNLISKAKALAFFQLITTRPMRQALLQANQMSLYMNRGDYAEYFFVGDGRTAAKGMKEYTTVWTGMLAKSLDNYDNVSDVLSKNLGVSKKQFDETITAYINSGLPASIDSHLWVSASMLSRNLNELSNAETAIGDATHTIKKYWNTGHKWIRRMGFDLGEQSQLLMAFLAEKRAWQLANNDVTDTLWKTPNALNTIAGRARALSGNMNPAGAFPFQSGWASGIFQFMSHTTKMGQMMIPKHLPNGFIAKRIPWLNKYAGMEIPYINKIVSETLTSQEKYRIMFTQLGMYGFGGVGITALYEKIRDEFTEETGVEVPREFTMIVEEGIMGAMINAGMYAIDNESGDLEISRSISPLGGAIGLNVNNPITAIYKLIMNTNAGASDWAGPGWDVITRMAKGSGVLWDMLVNESSLSTPEKAGAMMLQLSTSMFLEANPYILSRYESTLESYIARESGKLQTQENLIPRLTRVLLGVRSRKSREIQEAMVEQSGVFAGYDIAPNENYGETAAQAKMDFELYKRSWELLDKGELSRAELNSMMRYQSDLMSTILSGRELTIYKTALRDHMLHWYDDVDLKNPAKGREGNIENALIKKIKATYDDVPNASLEDMVARLKNFPDLPGKERLIERIEREIQRD